LSNTTVNHELLLLRNKNNLLFKFHLHYFRMKADLEHLFPDITQHYCNMAKKMNESFNDLFPDLVGSTPPSAKRARLSSGRQSSATKSRYKPLKFEFKAPAGRPRGPLETLLTPENNISNATGPQGGRFKEPPPPKGEPRL
jgi:hypothetical protein